MNELIGKTIDGFNFISIIGEGGMAFVYKAYDQKLDRFVAIKVIHPRISHSLISLQRFKKEARNQAKLLHPNIIAVLDLIKISSSVGIVMEYVEGESLSQLLKRCSRLDFAKTKEILRQALVGLNFAHSYGFVHRDIKPSNIIIRKDGVVKIADFGIAKSFSDSRPNSTASNIIGTAYYMSPEQIKGEHLSHHSDIYSIGCTAYEMVTGYPPFYLPNDFKVLQAHLMDVHAPLENWRSDLPQAFISLVNDSLQKQPRNRPKSCEVLIERLDSIPSLNFYPNYLPQHVTKAAARKAKSNYVFLKIILILLTIVICFLVIKNVRITNFGKEEPTNKQLNPFSR
ncbi:MAG: serine/threonine protein kinase [Ignavibacteriales bacterium]|nr:serine/threonine protein kinase [Ignavibacteriales bacterium]